MKPAMTPEQRREAIAAFMAKGGRGRPHRAVVLLKGLDAGVIAYLTLKSFIDHSQAGNDITAWVELADPDTPVGTRLELSCAVVGTGTPARRGVRTGLIVVTKLGGPNA